ncbi:MAG TPA: asparagine synthetase B family protein, partial [Gemmatimonadales bacterium]|nr:asparagine synthetase B family protein [Gemmatimonadales bacterium]
GPAAGRCLAEYGSHAVLNASGDAIVPLRSGPADGDLERLATDAETNAATVIASLRDGSLAVVVPPATPEHCYAARVSGGWVVSDDFRLFRRLGFDELDERAVYALFQFGAIPAPIALFRGVRRLPSGHVSRLAPRATSAAATAFFSSAAQRAGRTWDSGAPQRIRDALDAFLARLPERPLLFFSGGVDSGLLAARLAGIGRRDVRLVNYAFGTQDEGSLLAQGIAARLGLAFDRVPYDPGGIGVVLEAFGREYSFPFGDISTVPTSLLVREAIARTGHSGTVLEGTGADGAYGIASHFARWRQAYALPRTMRRWINATYRALRLWRGNGVAARAARFVGKSLRMPLAHAVVAQNALDEYLYPALNGVHEELQVEIERSIGALAAGVEPEEQLSLLDLVWVCAGRMAPKSFDPLRVRGTRPVYPYLEPAMIRLGASLSWREKWSSGEPKALLKSLLAEEIPPEWVYRPKSGFTPPAAEILASGSMQDYLHDVVLSRANPLLPWCRVDRVRKLADRAARRAGLGSGAYDFLWVLAFASGWLRQVPKCGG